MINLIEKLNKAIDTEYDSKNEELDELQLLSLEERVMKGDTIANITVNFIPLELNFKNVSTDQIVFTLVKLKCANNISKFREGSPVKLTGYGYSFNLDIVEDKGEEMELEVGWGVQMVPRALNNCSGWQLDPGKVDIRNVVKKSTSILANNQQKLTRIAGILDGTITPALLEQRKQEAISLMKASYLNEKQKKAFINAYSTGSYYLIQGPPGTGKTHVLAHLAVAFAKEGKKVLITASTHTAINNALQKTSALEKTATVIKVGKNNQTEGLNENGSTAINISDFSRSGYSNNSKGIIVGATCYSPHTKKLEFMEWDVVIIDEAGQLGIPLAVAAMVKADIYIFIGDHKQLPPIISEKNTDPIFSRSIFEHLFQFSQGIMLNQTYRMNAAINKFPSEHFYNSELVPDSSSANRLLNIKNVFDVHQQVLDIGFPEVLVCHEKQSLGSYSEYEANLCIEYLKQYILKGIHPGEIAIITPFRAQVRQIKKSLAASNIEGNMSKIFIDTIERIQGQEKDIIIYSLASSDPEQAKQRASFFFNLNRMNVALTRARKKRIVIANKNLFALHSYDSNINKMIGVFRDFYNDSYKVEIN